MKIIKNIIWRRFVSLLIMIALLFTMSTMAFAQENNHFPYSPRTVRVGVAEFSQYSYLEPDGTYSGILFDYLDEIVRYTGWNVEYVVDDPAKLIDQLVSGELDLMGLFNKNNQTLDMYNWSELSSGYSYSVLKVKEDREEYICNDFDSIQGIRVGIYSKSATRTESFDRFCKSNGITYIPVYYDDPEKFDNSIETGEVDAILTTSAKRKEDEKAVLNFQREEYYFAVTKGKTEITRELNLALEQIDKINPHLDSDLHKKYFKEYEQENFILTTKETQFVEENPILRVAVAPDWQPISYLNRATGAYQGISADIFQLLSNITGFQFEYIQTNSFDQAVDLIKTKQVDLLVGFPNNNQSTNQFDLIFSLPYLPIQTVILQKDNIDLKTLENPVLAVPYGFEYASNFKNCTVQYYNTMDECIDAVKRGKVDFAGNSMLAAEHYIRREGKGGLTLVPMTEISLGLSIAFENPTDPTLISIIDKAIYSISESQKQSIIFQNTSIENSKVSLSSFIQTNPTQSVVIIASVGLFIVLLLFVIMGMRLKLSKRAALRAQAYRIVGDLTGEYLFEYDFGTQKLELPQDFEQMIGHAAKQSVDRLISEFQKHKHMPNFAIEFKCCLQDGEEELFRAVCALIYNTHNKPVRGVGKITSIQAEFDEKQELEKNAATDYLTGLYNKKFCEEFVNNYFEHPDEHGNTALLLIDLDDFKQVNDHLGHLGGDAALQYLSTALKRVFQNNEILGRWGGDEFFVFAPDCADQNQLEDNIKSLCGSMNANFSYEGCVHKLSVSVGVAFTNKPSDLQEMFQWADDALYTVKRMSKNGYQINNTHQ